VRDQGAHFSSKRVALAAVAGGAAAAAANIGWFLLLRALGVEFRLQPIPTAPPAPVTVPNVAVASFIPALLAGGLLMLLGRFTTKARSAFVVIACVVFLLSLAGPATIGGASAGTRVSLMVMHLLAATIISGALVRGAVTTDGKATGSAGP